MFINKRLPVTSSNNDWSLKNFLDFFSKKMDESIVKAAGSSFIIGYGVGAGIGALTGMAQNLNELPLIQLNQTLNTASKYGERVGYQAAMATTIYNVSKHASDKYIQNPIITTSIAGGCTGAFCGSYWGVKGAIGGGVAGSAIGALVGYHQYKNQITVSELLK
ncbi:Mitochondrial import inner membrane translocase subunit Tim17 family protein [Tritrichomonas foetus]|uniref:Mitochondrial import inner membrane translocase subunit Tim17 family protein n=1 Tax=Tritrichomonas foetus TaxID=1144522 RepID=A0A1J4J181_9EUKA|nr:Mitochondrial import inner membrane translocase subunit Tim17 family protein [Tritrichomonas foetus]|eukprot:OHS93304.1 Mitochondrial import inner membrane translocase subunit Tim17 family protein [Tritrichomonas foetus]